MASESKPTVLFVTPTQRFEYVKMNSKFSDPAVCDECEQVGFGLDMINVYQSDQPGEQKILVETLLKCEPCMEAMLRTLRTAEIKVRGDLVSVLKHRLTQAPIPMWILCDALSLIRLMQDSVKSAGYYTALAGGVLNRGYSRNDLDLVFIRRSPLEANSYDLIDAIKAAGIILPLPFNDAGEYFFATGTYHNKPIDIIIPK